MKEKQKPECNICFSEMEPFVLAQHNGSCSDGAVALVCKKPDCPNFGLLQVPSHLMKSQ